MEADLSYYRRRSAEEAVAAAAAQSAIARDAHLELARRYDGEIARLGIAIRRAGFHIVEAA